MKRARRSHESETGIAVDLRQTAEQAFSRAAGAPLVAGNRLRLLRDATENYPAWLDAIASAREKVHFESYIFADDRIGREFADALVSRARAGVRVRVIYDWVGGLGKTTAGLLHALRAADIEVRAFNPFRFDSPFGWLTRDHRKSVVVDGRIAFASGLCVSDGWAGDPARGIAPWRDTGLAIEGPAVADVEAAFAEVWAACGAPLPEGALTPPESIGPAGDVAVRVIAATPSAAGLYRLDQLIASIARNRLWLADAYFVGVAPYVQALRAAALDGVDVRLLVPGSSDIPGVAALSRSGYRPLLEAGVRVFEWNGPMMHAKTALADGRWARVGSTNLNIASWIGNYELDVAVEDADFALEMEKMYESDLENATEIVLGRRAARRRDQQLHWRRRGSAGRAAASALRLSNAVGAALTDRRVLGTAESRLMLGSGGLLALLAFVALMWPGVVAIPLALIVGWIAAALLIKGLRLRNRELEAGNNDDAPEDDRP